MSWHPCEAEDCENGADEEGGLCGAHTKLIRVTRALERAKEFLAAVNYKVGNKTAIEILESIISGEDKL